MKNLSNTVAVTALIAFSLGYIARGPVERAPNISTDREESAVREHTESPKAPAQTEVRADPNSANGPVSPSPENVAVLTSTSSTPRAAFARNKRDMLGDFFLINGIGTNRAEQIIQELIDAEHHLAEEGNAMLDRAAAQKAELIAQGEVVRVTHSAEEKAELNAERESLYRQVFGEYYEAHEAYRRSYPQRRVVRTFSARLEEPLEYTAKETLVQIMYEEHSRFVSEPANASAESGVQLTTTPQGLDAEKEEYHEQLLAKQSFNERVLDRTKAYLTHSQFEQFKRLLDNDVRRFELLMEISEL